jgi:phosphate:Na+ symporter
LVAEVVGGLGLFLMGMWLMTDGLKLAAGDTLKAILERWTSTPGRGFLTGLGLTGAVQSSSAVTMATIGFANAGLLTLHQSVWVIYGANVGTTLTGWIVQLVGFRLDIGLYAMPLVGLGMALRLTGGTGPRAAYGQALAGAGVLFLGIAALKGGFEGLAATVALPEPSHGPLVDRLIYVAVGIVLTTLMQSSSALLVVALSLLASGIVPLPLAGAMVLGAAVGTTTTAILAAIGATPTAKRVASAHVVFATLAATIGFVALVPLMEAIAWALAAVGLAPEPTLVLVLFFTAVKLAGVAAIWPLTPALTRFLEARFRAAPGAPERLAYLDRSVREVPSVAIAAAVRETERLRDIAEAALAAWLAEPGDRAGLAAAAARVRAIAEGIAAFLADLGRDVLRPEEVARLHMLLRVLQHYMTAFYDAQRAAAALGEAGILPEERATLGRAIRATLARPETMGKDRERALKAELGTLKGRLLARAAEGGLPFDALDATLRGMNAEVRMLRRLRKGRHYLDAIGNPVPALEADDADEDGPEAAAAEAPGREPAHPAPA